MYRDTKILLSPLSTRLNTMPLKKNMPLVPERTVASAPAPMPFSGEAMPSSEVSCGYPGSKPVRQVAPQSNDLNQPSHASFAGGPAGAAAVDAVLSPGNAPESGMSTVR